MEPKDLAKKSDQIRYLSLMLSLFLLNRISSRPRLGKKPATRRFIQLTAFFFFIGLLFFGIFGKPKEFIALATEALIDIPLQAANLANITDSSIISLEEPIEETTEVSFDDLTLPTQKNDSFRVKLISYNQIRKKELEKSLADYQAKTKRLKELEKSTLEASSQEAEGSYYLSSVERKIERAGNRRWLASGKKLIGEAEVEIEISYDGTIHDLTLFVSSGSSLVDRELMTSVREAAPFPPVPLTLREHGEESISIIRWLRFIIEANK